MDWVGVYWLILMVLAASMSLFLISNPVLNVEDMNSIQRNAYIRGGLWNRTILFLYYFVTSAINPVVFIPAALITGGIILLTSLV